MAAKSPPGVFQSVGVVAEKCRAFQVASPSPAAMPWPTPAEPLTVLPAAPSPQSSDSRYKWIVGLAVLPLASELRKSVNCTLLMVDPAGIEAAISKSINPRRGESCALVPEKIAWPAPRLLLTL